MTKRNIFADLMEGFDALEGSRKGKVTLQTTEVEIKAAPKMTAARVRAVREKHSANLPGECIDHGAVRVSDCVRELYNVPEGDLIRDSICGAARIEWRSRPQGTTDTQRLRIDMIDRQKCSRGCRDESVLPLERRLRDV